MKEDLLMEICDLDRPGALSQRVVRDALFRAVQRLSDYDSEVFGLYWNLTSGSQLMTTDQVAEQLHIPVSTTGIRLARAHQVLRHEMASNKSHELCAALNRYRNSPENCV